MRRILKKSFLMQRYSCLEITFHLDFQVYTLSILKSTFFPEFIDTRTIDERIQSEE